MYETIIHLHIDKNSSDEEISIQLQNAIYAVAVKVTEGLMEHGQNRRLNGHNAAQEITSAANQVFLKIAKNSK